ncbi:MAG TPA: metal ABC transporter substrate-binding protein [Syntrophales bacterium]|nr:metal ABC transporter substrate-binding protein [Syntrophales bacterium]
MKKLLLALLIAFAVATPAHAKMNVVATLPWIGDLAGELGKDKINVKVLVKPSQDPHYVEAKPSMILAARDADILMYNGLDLEIGYLPLLLESSRNSRIQPGQPGNFDCSRFVNVIEKQQSVDRSMGDVHPLGNPHYLFSPSNILRVIRGMSQELSSIDPGNAAFYKVNLASFEEKLKNRQTQWRKRSLKGKKFVAYHKYFEYMANDFGFQIVGYVEAKPGIPPSAGHVESLIESMKKTKPDGILVTPAYGKEEAEALGKKTGVKVIVVPQDVGSLPGTSNWFSFMDTVLSSLQ